MTISIRLIGAHDNFNQDRKAEWYLVHGGGDDVNTQVAQCYHIVSLGACLLGAGQGSAASLPDSCMVRPWHHQRAQQATELSLGDCVGECKPVRRAWSRHLLPCSATVFIYVDAEVAATYRLGHEPVSAGLKMPSRDKPDTLIPGS